MAKIRVYELAKALGMESRQLVTMLGEAGEFVRSASSTLERPVIVELCRLLDVAVPTLESLGEPRMPDGSAPTWPQVVQRPVPPLGLSRGAAPRPLGRSMIRPEPRPDRAGDQDAADAVAILGPTARPRSKGSLPTPEDRQQARERQRDREWEKLWALNALIPADERRLWVDAGIAPDDFRGALTCSTHRVFPEHLRIKVDGVTVAARLRGGEPIGSVVARLKERGYLSETG